MSNNVRSPSSGQRVRRCGQWAALALVAWLVACSSPNEPEATPPFADGEGIQVGSVDSTLPSELTNVYSEVEGYALVVEYLASLLPDSPGLQRSALSPSMLAQCMVERGYQNMQIPLFAQDGATLTTLATPEQMLSPMLGYLAESCSGVPMSEWSRATND